MAAVAPETREDATLEEGAPEQPTRLDAFRETADRVSDNLDALERDLRSLQTSFQAAGEALERHLQARMRATWIVAGMMLANIALSAIAGVVAATVSGNQCREHVVSLTLHSSSTRCGIDDNAWRVDVFYEGTCTVSNTRASTTYVSDASFPTEEACQAALPSMSFLSTKTVLVWDTSCDVVYQTPDKPFTCDNYSYSWGTAVGTVSLMPLVLLELLVAWAWSGFKCDS